MGVIVVCDTNVFVRDSHLLRKKGGPDLVRHLKATQGQLLVPEILRIEYIEQTLEAANAERQRFEAATGVLGTLIGFQPPIFPTEDAINQTAIERLRALESITQTASLTTEVLEAAGRRAIGKRRPTTKNDHGYKDCLIWESILRLPSGSDVRFVSRDNKAFFSGENLAQELIDEARAKGIRVVGYQNVDNLVRDLRTENPSDLAAVEAQDQMESVTVVPQGAAAAIFGHAPIVVVSNSAASTEVESVGDIQGVSSQLADARKRFDDIELKVFAYIAYLDPAGQDQLFQLLSEVQIPPAMAKNMAERLVMYGLVRDVGNHYLVVDRALADMVAPSVEDEIIALLDKSAGGHGN